MVQYLLCHFYTVAPDIMMCYVQLSALQKWRIRILLSALQISICQITVAVANASLFQLPDFWQPWEKFWGQGAYDVDSTIPNNRIMAKRGDLLLNVGFKPKKRSGILYIQSVLPISKVRERNGCWKICTGYGRSQTQDRFLKSSVSYLKTTRSPLLKYYLTHRTLLAGSYEKIKVTKLP